jgi:hypothetical protein
MCEAYHSPRRIIDIASFAGPTLYRELVLVDRESLSLLKDCAILRQSLGLAGWTGEVLGSMGRDWVSKMAMLEGLWILDSSLGVLSTGEMARDRIARLRLLLLVLGRHETK